MSTPSTHSKKTRRHHPALPHFHQQTSSPYNRLSRCLENEHHCGVHLIQNQISPRWNSNRTDLHHQRSKFQDRYICHQQNPLHRLLSGEGQVWEHIIPQADVEMMSSNLDRSKDTPKHRFPLEKARLRLVPVFFIIHVYLSSNLAGAFNIPTMFI